MDSVQSWMNADEVRRLAGRLLSRTGGDPLPSPETPFGNDFEGFEGVAPPPAEPVTPLEAPPPIQGAAEPVVPVVPVPEPSPVPAVEPAPVATADAVAEETAAVGPVLPPPTGLAVPPVLDAGAAEVPRGPFLQRVQRFRDWLREQFAARGVFLLDRDGRVIFDDGVNPKLHALARSLAVASRVAAGAGNVHFKIGTEATLEVIPVETHYGPMVLGAVVPAAIAPRGVALIIDGLTRAATPPDGR